MTDKHTPGPWYIDGGSVTSDALHQMDCIVDHVYGPVANAHLIAAAPELLEALKAAEWVLKQSRPESGWFERYGHVIAKAEGK